MLDERSARCQRDKGRRQVRCAFTLIELLVVVAIIALLIALLVPSLARARRQAKSTVCMSNLRQTGMGINLYAAEENNIIMPLGQSGAFDWYSNPIQWYPYAPYWYQRCARYFGGNSTDLATNSGGQSRFLIFRCPIAAQDVVPLWDQGGSNIMYGINRWIAPYAYNYNGVTSLERPLRRLSSIQKNLVLVGDDYLWWNQKFYFSGVLTHDRPPWPFETGVSGIRLKYEGHNHGAHFLFTDLHVEWRGILPFDNEPVTPAPSNSEWRDSLVQ